jgi:hypothetical protein
VSPERDDGDADDGSQRRQHQPEAERRPYVVPRRGQAALGEDEDQGTEPEREGEIGVGELDARTGVAEQKTES